MKASTFLSFLLVLISIQVASAGIFLSGEDAKYEASLSSVSIPTQAVKIKSIFLSNADATTEINLNAVSIPTKPSPLKEIFLSNADAVFTQKLTPMKTVQVPPIASFTFIPSQPTVGQSVTFDASSSYDPDGYIVKYEWDFGDGTTASGVIVSHVYSQLGTYTVTLTVTDNDGLTNSTSMQVIVTTPPENYTVIFDENFENLSKWYLVVYNSAGGSENDPAPTLDTTMGLPAPSLDVNGDSWCGNGAYTKETFDYTNGLLIEFDMYVASGYDWNWGWCGLSDHKPNLNNPRPDGAYVDPLRCDPSFVAGIHFTDDGSYNQKPPSLWFGIKAEDGTIDGYTYAKDASEFQNKWNHYKIYIRPDGYVEFYMNGSLIWVSTKKIDRSYSPMPLLLGSRDAYGPVRVDNVKVKIPSVALANVTMSPQTLVVSPDSTSTIDVVLDKVPSTGLSYVNVSVSISNSTVAEIGGIEFPAWATLTDKSTLPASTVWFKVGDLSNQVKAGDTNVVLATLTIRGLNPGTSNIVITVNSFQDDSYQEIKEQIATVSGTITVIAGPPPIDDYQPKDLDGDGLYEDVNGDGIFNFGDVIFFFMNFDKPEIQNYPEYYDFNNDGSVNFGDVIALFQML